MVILKQYSIVRVKKTPRSGDEYNRWQNNRRPPQIGDIGTIIEILQAPNLPTGYVVECSDNDGMTIWLSIFFTDEIELEKITVNC